jgi:UMF1 family MFS transporter
VSATQVLSPAADTVHGSRREQLGWSIYDWANSVFSTTVVTVFIGPYLTSVTKAAADSAGFVHPLGIPMRAEAFFPTLISLSVLLQVLILPVLGALADYSNRKKDLLGLCAYVGALATMGLYFLHGTNYLYGGVLFLVANLAFGASIVSYNAILPEIAAADERDSVSSLGFGLGYLGGGVLLGANLVLVWQAPALGLELGDAARICLASAGVWWAIFTVVPLLTIQRRAAVHHLPAGRSYLTVGFAQLRGTLLALRGNPQSLLFLVAYLLYNDGIQTVVTLSASFGQEELGLGLTTLTGAILMVQLVAFVGALAFDRDAGALGTKRAVMLSLAVWAGVVCYSYFFLRTTTQFFLLAAVIALVLGGSQALSRSLFSLMIPKGREAEYFSLYEVSDRGTSWLGPLLAALALQLTGSYRVAILSLVVFFVAGLLLLTLVNVRRAIEMAGNQAPRRV